MKIKQIPEDFIVEEIPKSYFLKDHKKGSYTYFKLTKKGIDTKRAMITVSSRIKRHFKDISYSGLKDKDAITSQICSVKGKITEFKQDNLEIKITGRGERPVSLGYTNGNKFQITIREIPIDYKIKRTTDYIPNYYDTQRFRNDMRNVLLGKYIIKKDFENLFKELKINDMGQLRKRFQTTEIRFFLSAYNSFLFNTNLSVFLKKQSKKVYEDKKNKLCFPKNKEKLKLDSDMNFPLLGFGLDSLIKEAHQDRKSKNQIKKIIKKTMKKEQISDSDFIIREIPEISLESSLRKAFIKVENFQIINQDLDDLNKGYKKITLSFQIPPGSYATIVIKDIFSDLSYQKQNQN